MCMRWEEILLDSGHRKRPFAAYGGKFPHHP